MDTKLDSYNCGACGKVCATGSLCAGGTCGCLPTGTPCGTGQSCCGNVGCKSLQSDINNCGACGKVCGSGSLCDNGVCKCNGVECAAGQTCCQGLCAATCATAPDMAGTGAACTCASGCPISKVCVGHDCCLEDALITKTCKPDVSCLQSMTNP